MHFKLFAVVVSLLIPGIWSICKTIEELDQCAYQLSFLENREIPVPYNEADVLQSCK